jgi:hypothetical protein
MRFWKRGKKKKKPEYDCKKGKHNWIPSKFAYWFDESFHPKREMKGAVELYCPLCGRIKFTYYPRTRRSVHDFVDGRFPEHELECIGHRLETIDYDEIKRSVE